MKYDAILFDLDGTLIDTIGLWIDSYAETLKEHSVDLDRESFLNDSYAKGLDLKDNLERAGIDIDKEDSIREERDERYINNLTQRANWIGDAENVVRTAHSLYSTGIVTGSWKTYTDALDKRFGIYEMVNTTVTCDDMQGKCKPDPFSLLLAAEQLNVNPKKCLYIGDQSFDVSAAQAAGMQSCLIPGMGTPSIAHQAADIVLESIDDVLTLL